MHGGQARDSDEVRCHLGRTASERPPRWFCTLNECGRLISTSRGEKWWSKQGGVASSDGGKNCVAGARSPRKIFGQRLSGDHQRWKTCCSQGVYILLTASRGSDTKRWCRLAVIPAANGPSRHVGGYQNRTLQVAGDNLRDASSEDAAAAEVVGICLVLCGELREFFDLKHGELDASPHASEFRDEASEPFTFVQALEDNSDHAPIP